MNKVPNSELAEWDAKHDAVGKEISSGSRVDSNTGSSEDEVIRQRVLDKTMNRFRCRAFYWFRGVGGLLPREREEDGIRHDRTYEMDGIQHSK